MKPEGRNLIRPGPPAMLRNNRPIAVLKPDDHLAGTLVGAAVPRCNGGAQSCQKPAGGKPALRRCDPGGRNRKLRGLGGHEGVKVLIVVQHGRSLFQISVFLDDEFIAHKLKER